MLTLCFYTSRKEPRVDWLVESLQRQLDFGEWGFDVPETQAGRELKIVIVDALAEEPGRFFSFNVSIFAAFDIPEGRLRVKHVLPKPNVWQGKHRLTKEDWWAIANARNTGLCYAAVGKPGISAVSTLNPHPGPLPLPSGRGSSADWICWIDDRSVLVPTCLQAIREAMEGGYAVCGAYEKRRDLIVENGVIKDLGTLMGKDAREAQINRNIQQPTSNNQHPRPIPAQGSWWCGGIAACPVEWALDVNGVDETCDSLGLEDNLFGCMLQNAGYPIKYDTRLKVIEDRTPGPAQESSMFKRTDKGVSPNDKSHALLYKLCKLDRAAHVWGNMPGYPSIREIREIVLAGGEFPVPTLPDKDWWDGTPLGEMRVH